MSRQTIQSHLRYRRSPGEPKSKLASRSHWGYASFILGTSMLLMAGHYTFGEWVFHPKVALLQESAFWYDGCSIIIWPVVFWLFWTITSWGKINSAPVILIAAGIIGLGDGLWYFMARYLQGREVGISPDYWSWWIYWAPAVAIGGNLILVWRWLMLFALHSVQPTGKVFAQPRGSWLRSGFRSVGIVVGIGALLVALMYQGLPRLSADEWTLALARQWLISTDLRDDFNSLVASGGLQWHRYPVAVLLQSLKLADSQRHRFYTNIDEVTFQNYILSPQVDVSPLPDLDWRPVFWQAFSPHLHQVNTPRETAQIMVRLLREHIGIDPAFSADAGVLTAWREGFTDEKGFNRIYVATLRTVGVASRLDGRAFAEIWNGTNWEPAPRPLITSFCN